MADGKAAENNPANTSGGNANRESGKSSRRRPLRSKRRGRKPEESGKPEARSEARKDAPTDNRSAERAEGRGEPRHPRVPRSQHGTSTAMDKTLRDNRERRRRRRMRAKQRGQQETNAPVEDSLKDLPPLVPAFVYTHVLRPATRDTFEFRSEHFSKVTRKLEDFHIDLSPLYPDGGDEIKGVAWMPPASERPAIVDDREFDDGGYDDGDDDDYIDDDYADDDYADDADAGADAAELFDDPDWDAEESEDAARLDGAIADDFYAEMEDSVVDEYPDEELDD